MKKNVEQVIQELKEISQLIETTPNLVEELEKAESAPKAKEYDSEDGGSEGEVEESEVRDAEETSLKAKREDDKTPGARQIVHSKQDLGEQITPEQDKKDKTSPPKTTTIAKDEMCKDDEPHAPNTPEDKAHDVAEGESLPKALEVLPLEELKRQFFEHLRGAKQEGWDRSPENQEAGMEKADKSKEREKGVHGAAFMHHPRYSGTSEVGARMAPGGAGKKTNEWAKEQHKEKLAELKAMPKPNLPKSELDKAAAPAVPKTPAPAAQKPAMPAKGSQITVQDKKVNPASVNKLADAGFKVKTVFKSEMKSYDEAKQYFVEGLKKSSSYQGSIRPADGDKFLAKLKAKENKPKKNSKKDLEKAKIYDMKGNLKEDTGEPSLSAEARKQRSERAGLKVAEPKKEPTPADLAIEAKEKRIKAGKAPAGDKPKTPATKRAKVPATKTPKKASGTK